MGQQQWQQAVDNYTKAILIAPFENDLLNRGRAYLELKNLDKAIADFKAAAGPNNAAAWAELGSATFTKKTTTRRSRPSAKPWRFAAPTRTPISRS